MNPPGPSTPKRHVPRSLLFRRQREGEWEELDALVNRAMHRGLGALQSAELERLPVLYRNTLSSLMVARETAMDRELLRYLEALSARAYLVVYGSRRPSRAPLFELLLEKFPAEVRASLPELGVSVGVFLVGLGVSAALVSSDPSWFDSFVNPTLAAGRNPGTPTAELRAQLYHQEVNGLSSFSSALFTHNAEIGLLACALGIGAGLPTLALIFRNGTMLGAFVALYGGRGLSLPLLAWLLPHGVPELLAILLCGAAGLKLGRAVLFPGSRKLADALRLAGRRASLIVAGSLVLFLMAGIFEGVFRQRVTSDWLRWCMILFNVAWTSAWLSAGGRRSSGVP